MSYSQNTLNSCVFVGNFMLESPKTMILDTMASSWRSPLLPQDNWDETAFRQQKVKITDSNKFISAPKLTLLLHRKWSPRLEDKERNDKDLIRILRWEINQHMIQNIISYSVISWTQLIIFLAWILFFQIIFQMIIIKK